MSDRQARCAYGCAASVTPSRPGLAFFVDKSAGSPLALKTCRHCRYHDVAHEKSVMARNTNLKCTTFEPRAEGWEYDEYYCGCHGWD